MWIGLHEERAGAWAWVTGEPLASPSWNLGEPNNFGGAEACAEWLAVGGTWNDTRCEQEQGYLCQAPSPGGKLTCSGRAFTLGATRYCLQSEAQLAWPDAKRACEATSGTLAVLRTPEENLALREALGFVLLELWFAPVAEAVLRRSTSSRARSPRCCTPWTRGS